MPSLLVERDRELAIVRLHRPQRLNAVNEDMRRDLPIALALLEADQGVRAVVIAGSERAFSSGQDLEEAAAFSPADIPGWFTRQHAMFAALRGMNKPTVAALRGVAAGAGYQIALYCDLRVGHPELRLGQPEVKTGLGSILGSSQMMWHLPLGINAELSLGGELIDGTRAERLGLLNRLVARDEVMQVAAALARELGARPPHAVRLTKERLRELTQAAFDDTLEAAKRYQTRAWESGEPQRRMREFLAARGAADDGQEAKR